MTALTLRGWLCIATVGNEFQMGLPDVWAAHKRYGQRWIEIKNPLAYSFTPAQLDIFPLMASVGVGVWILTAATEYELNKIFGPPNWHTYLSIFK